MAVSIPLAVALSPLLWVEGAAGIKALAVVVPIIFFMAVGTGFVVPFKSDDVYQQIVSSAMLGRCVLRCLRLLRGLPPALWLSGCRRCLAVCLSLAAAYISDIVGEEGP